MHRLIGLNGRMHSGKDTVCEVIESQLVTKRIAFADKLKMSACAALGIPFEDAVDAVRICDMLKERGSVHILLGQNEDDDHGPLHWFTGRKYLQWYGTESHRDIFGQDFWVDALLPKWYPGSEGHLLQDRFPGTDVVVITDVRFPNEAQRIRDLGGEVWHIDADERLGTLPEDAHISEFPLTDELITWTLDNNGTIDELVDNIAYGLSERDAVS
jgi:hypothetical protein